MEESEALMRPIISSRATVKAVGAVATTVGTTQEPLVQTGQMCDPDGPACMSAQKWNCPARRRNPRSNASSRMRRSDAVIFEIRRSLGKNGCAVKGRMPQGATREKARFSERLGVWYKELVRFFCDVSTVWPRNHSERRTELARGHWQSTIAFAACLALVFSLALGATVHRHDSAATRCHICQLGHMPILATSAPELVSSPGPAVGYVSLPVHAAPMESCALHRASRAPPAA